jgi:uncharacterized protein
MKPFLLKLFAPRPTFHLDLTPEEMSVMQTHAQYSRRLLEQGTAIAFGPVLDPKESWGGMHIEVYPMASLVHK